MNKWFNRSKNYANLKWAKREDFLEAVKKECKLNKNSTVCDVGTGTGAIASYLQTFCRSINAIDTSQDMLARARYFHKDKDKICFHQMNAEKMDFKANSFDCVVARMSFHHIINLNKAMKECYRILKKGGRLVICEGIPPNGCYEFHKEVFKITEERHDFRAMDIINLFEFCNFKKIDYKLFTAKQLSVRNWVSNLGLPHHLKEPLFNMWKNSPAYVKRAHNIVFANNDVSIDWLYIIVSGVKE